MREERERGSGMIQRIAGSTGTAPVQDATARGGFVTAVWIIINLIARKTGALNAADLADVSLVLPILAFGLWGFYDKWIRPLEPHPKAPAANVAQPAQSPAAQPQPPQ
jgi:hypothetical protein